VRPPSQPGRPGPRSPDERGQGGGQLTPAQLAAINERHWAERQRAAACDGARQRVPALVLRWAVTLAVVALTAIAVVWAYQHWLA
jgi:hypothetical protein